MRPRVIPADDMDPPYLQDARESRFNEAAGNPRG